MKLLLVGSSVEDHIHLGEKEEIRPGGIYYTIKGITSIISSEDQAYPLTALSDKTRHLFDPLYSSVAAKYVYETRDIPLVHLHLHGEMERCEWYENITSRLDISVLDGADIFDGILINMITGFDITHQDLRRLRRLTAGPVYLDLHTLSRGMDAAGKRMFRPVPDLNDWLSAVDILQVNENELLTLNDIASEVPVNNSESGAIEKAFSLGVKLLVVTRGSKGASVYWRDDENMVMHHEPVFGGKLKMPVGCGDIFGAVFFYNYIASHGNPYIAVRAASRAAGTLIR